MNNLVVEFLYRDFEGLVEYLENKGEISFKSTADNNFKKNLILSSASFFESKITEDLGAYFKEKAPSSLELSEFLVNKGVKRQYHTYFDWDSSNANAFFSLFGMKFKSFMAEKIKNNDELRQAIIDFLELGRERNRLVHQNFGSYTVEKTSKEIYSLYESACKFVLTFKDYLHEYNGCQQAV